MKNIKFLLLVFLLFLFAGCQNQEPITYTINLNVSEEIKEFVDFEQNYEVTNGDKFVLPNVIINPFVTYEQNQTDECLEVFRCNNVVDVIGWVDSAGNTLSESSVIIDKDTTFTLSYAIYKTKTKLKVHLNGGEISSEFIENNGVLTLPIPTKENYSFLGWYKNYYFIGDEYKELDFNDVSVQFSLYAKYAVSPDYVTKLIDELPSVLSVNEIDDLLLIQELYNNVTPEDKGLVENYSKFIMHLAELDELQQAKELYQKLEYLYQQQSIIDVMNELEEVNEIIASLDESTLKYVVNLDLNKLQSMNDELDNMLAMYLEEAQIFDKEIAKIPVFMEQYYEDEILNLYYEYSGFNNIQKSLLKAAPKLEKLYSDLMELENSSELIYYLNPESINNVYLSKDELCEAFFTDFYYYIVTHHGTSHLEKNGLYTVDDFVNLSQDFTGAGANNLYGIGNIAGRYLLEKDINGILENQTDGAFFGFCYQNDLYQDVLPFFINFFAYWRIDEGYATTSNYGADIFAESWAPTVDIAKFFYYDENTSYVKSERMIDCLTNTASVVYGMDGDLPTIRLRGYKFMGWYDNPEFTGNPLTSTDNISGNKIYAKWSVDQEQVDQDSANLVCIYIYNLTTRKSVLNKTTVGYVETMYNNLTENAKKFVYNYNRLVEFIADYK